MEARAWKMNAIVHSCEIVYELEHDIKFIINPGPP